MKKVIQECRVPIKQDTTYYLVMAGFMQNQRMEWKRKQNVCRQMRLNGLKIMEVRICWSAL
jgi:hypothetical protein